MAARNLKCNTEPTGILWRVLSLGVGVQSSTIYWLAQLGLIPKYDFAIFADTENEPKTVYEYLKLLKANANKFPLVVVTNGNLSESATELRVSKTGRTYTRRLLPFFTKQADGKMGRMQTRGCTQQFKIEPINRYLRTVTGIQYGQNFPSIELHLGISTDESSRMKDARYPWMIHKYPLIDLGMSRQDCLKTLERNNIQLPPRSSCYFCPFHSAAEWQMLAREQPEDFQKAVEVEKAIQISHKSVGLKSEAYLTRYGKNLAEIDFDEIVGAKNNSSIQQSFNWIEECSGHCGV